LAMSRVRVREFFTQTAPPTAQDSSAQTDPIVHEKDHGHKKKVRRSSRKIRNAEEGPKKAAFAGADKLKEKAKAASMQPPYNVANFYYEAGMCQKIARSQVFENLTLFVVFVNAIWIGVDTDLNDAALLVSADYPFLIAENTFCFYFTCELLIRFGAFEKKLNCLRDAWFDFDLCLVLLMVAETWVLTLVVILLDLKFESGAGGGMNIIRMFKLAKLLRLSRMARLLRAVPELVIIMKGLGFAARSVSIFFLLTAIIVYLFAVLFRQLTDGMDVGALHFQSVPHAMDTLLLNGVFADSQRLISEMATEEILLWPIIIFFFALVSVTIMYMLVGVLVDVVGLVATVEKEGIEVSYIAGLLRSELQRLGYKPDGSISQFEFQKLMLEPSIVKIVAGAGVDVIVLADMMDLITEDINRNGGQLAFTDLMDLVLNMRGSNPATVKDFKEQIRMFKVILNESMHEAVGQIRKQLVEVQNQMQDVNSDSDSADEDGKIQAVGLRSESGSEIS